MMEIVPIAADHIESFHRTLDTVAREQRYLAMLEAPPLDAFRKFVQENIKRAHAQFVVLSAGEVVGWCDVLPSARPVHAHIGVLGMGMLASHRGQGIGRRLLNRTLDAARANGLSRIELRVREDNANAIALYRATGFATEGMQRHAIKTEGRYENLILMALLFED